MQQILANPDRVQETFRSGGEVFFRYGGFVFSILHSKDRDASYGPYGFYVYPKWNDTLANLAKASDYNPEGIDMASFNSGQFDEEVEKSLFRDLYNMVTNKSGGVDSVFDAILRSK
jgi:hypothetical protein